jgi:hypothetical protein
VSRYLRWVENYTRISFIGILIITGIVTAMAVADLLFGLGWGYETEAVFIGLGIMVFACILYVLCKGIFTALR